MEFESQQTQQIEDQSVTTRDCDHSPQRTSRSTRDLGLTENSETLTHGELPSRDVIYELDNISPENTRQLDDSQLVDFRPVSTVAEHKIKVKELLERLESHEEDSEKSKDGHVCLTMKQSQDLLSAVQHKQSTDANCRTDPAQSVRAMADAARSACVKYAEAVSRYDHLVHLTEEAYLDVQVIQQVAFSLMDTACASSRLAQDLCSAGRQQQVHCECEECCPSREPAMKPEPTIMDSDIDEINDERKWNIFDVLWQNKSSGCLNETSHRHSSGTVTLETATENQTFTDKNLISSGNQELEFHNAFDDDFSSKGKVLNVTDSFTFHGINSIDSGSSVDVKEADSSCKAVQEDLTLLRQLFSSSVSTINDKAMTDTSNSSQRKPYNCRSDNLENFFTTQADDVGNNSAVGSLLNENEQLTVSGEDIKTADVPNLSELSATETKTCSRNPEGLNIGKASSFTEIRCTSFPGNSTSNKQPSRRENSAASPTDEHGQLFQLNDKLHNYIQHHKLHKSLDVLPQDESLPQQQLEEQTREQGHTVRQKVRAIEQLKLISEQKDMSTTNYRRPLSQERLSRSLSPLLLSNEKSQYTVVRDESNSRKSPKQIFTPVSSSHSIETVSRQSSDTQATIGKYREKDD